MSKTETDLLRESIDRLTRDEQPPAGLAGRAFLRHRRRTITLRAAAAGAAVIAATGVLVAVARPGAGPAPGTHQAPARQAAAGPAVRTAAYVFGRTERALAAAEEENLVEEIHTVSRNYPLGLAEVLTYHLNGETYHVIRQAGMAASQEDIWSYHGQLRERGLDAAGKPVFDASSTTTRSPAGSRTVMSVSGAGVDYGSRTWWRTALQFSLPAGSGQSGCASAYLPPPVGTTVDWAAEIRAALSCGHYQLAGTEQVGTVSAIKLVSAKVNGPYTETLWVDPRTYLPIRLTWHWLDQRGQGPGTLTGDFRWVQPTQANLGDLRVTVPGGFERAPTGGLPVPGLDL